MHKRRCSAEPIFTECSCMTYQYTEVMTEVQTLGALYACAQLIDGYPDWATQCATRFVIVNGFRAALALDLDTYSLCNLVLVHGALNWLNPVRSR